MNHKSNIDFEEIAEWLSVLYRESRGHIHISCTGNWAGRFFNLDNGFAKPALYVEQLGRSTTPGIYARITTITSPPSDSRHRGGASLTASIPALWADIDLEGPGHKHTPCPDNTLCGHQPPHTRPIQPLPPHEEAARAIVALSGLPKPSVWINSGGGLYPMWLINPIHHITGDLERVQDLSTAWQRILAKTFNANGYHYGSGVGDLARVLRIPGTWNRKTATARRCHIIEYNLDGYSLHALEDAALKAKAKWPEPEPTKPPVTPPRGRGDLRPGDDFIARVDWADQMLLGRLGWRVTLRRGSYREWLRPEAGPTSTLSATTGRGEGDNLYVFSTETPFPVGVPVTKLEAFRLLNGYPTHRDAVQALGKLGFGAPPAPPPHPTPLDWPSDYTKTRP